MAATSADVCYRHPQRESWTLCTRCGRTICPECQILTPSGVQCPDCVKETGGSVKWQSAGGEIKRPAAKTRSARPSGPRPTSGSGFGATLSRMLRPGDTTPVASWTVIGLFVGLWIIGFLLPQGLTPSEWLAARVDHPIEIWRYATAPFGTPSVFQAVLSVLLGAVFFALIAPAVEGSFGRQRFVVIFLAGAVLGSTSTIVAGGGAAFGLTGALFGLFGAYIVKIWEYPQARVQVLIMVGINLIFGIVSGGLPQIVGGLIAGVGGAWLLQRYDGRRSRTAYLIIAAVAAAFIVLAVARSLVL